MKLYSLLPALFASLLLSPVMAQPTPPQPPAPPSATAPAEAPNPLLDLLRRIEERSQLRTQEMRDREQQFVTARERQAELLRQARADLEAAELLSDQLKDTFDNNERRLVELETQLTMEMGEMGEVFGVVRQIVGDARAKFDTSLVSAQLPGRGDRIAPLGQSSVVPNAAQLEALWVELLREITQSGQVVSFRAPVLTPQGREVTRDVIRFGTFGAISEGRFLRFMPTTGQLVELTRQPPGRFLSLAENFANSREDFPLIAIDPTQGSLLSLYVQNPNLSERIAQGRFVGIVILVLGAIGLIIALERILYLGLVYQRMKGQLKAKDPSLKNPLGRIMAVYLKYNNKEHDVETLSLKLDEAIMKETPAFDRGVPTLKILAAIAPLLGLLGTVNGMINTFQAITLFGTGDPKLMAGGISEALVTTVLGLVVAIPLVLLHSYVSSRSEKATQMLDEQGAGLLAEFADKLHLEETAVATASKKDV
jgi:biopolymer transport protein ExbB